MEPQASLKRSAEQEEQKQEQHGEYWVVVWDLFRSKNVSW